MRGWNKGPGGKVADSKFRGEESLREEIPDLRWKFQQPKDNRKKMVSGIFPPTFFPFKFSCRHRAYRRRYKDVGKEPIDGDIKGNN
jgi:hypothetical protein